MMLVRKKMMISLCTFLPSKLFTYFIKYKCLHNDDVTAFYDDVTIYAFMMTTLPFKHVKDSNATPLLK